MSKIRLILGVLIFSLSLLFNVHTLADSLTYQLTQGVDSPITAAITPFSSNESFSKMIQQDLNNSGEFDAILVNSSAKLPTSVQYLIRGTMQSSSDDQVQVQLVNVANKNKTLFQKNFEVDDNNLNQLAHYVSDKVYQKLTRVRGLFLTRIAYIAVQQVGSQQNQYQLEVASSDGSNATTIITANEPILSPTFSPDGKQLAYMIFENGQSKIYLQDLATGHRIVLVNFKGLNSSPAFSPDNKSLAFVSTKSGSSKIYRMNLQTHSVTQMTHELSIDTEPCFSPDGNLLYFTSDRGGSPQIYQYNLQTKLVKRLTFNGHYNAHPVVTSNGKTLVFMHQSGGMFDIAEENLSTGQVQILTQSGWDKSPTISPNGKMILYETRSGGRSLLGLISLDGRIQARLVSKQSNLQQPAFSPFLERE